MRKHYSATFKADAIKELMKEEKTLSQLAAELGVHPSQLKDWKKIALQGLPELFSREGKAGEQAKVHEQQVNELYGEIGRLTTQVNWLKKKSGLNPESRPEGTRTAGAGGTRRARLVAQRAGQALKSQPLESLLPALLSLGRGGGGQASD